MEDNLAVVSTLFDVTTRIPHIPIWSCHGIYEYINSQEAKNQRELRAETRFLEVKAQGAQAVRTNDYRTAVYWYTEGMRMKPTDATLFSNRSLCYSHLNVDDLALSDAEFCKRLRPDWCMGHYREGVAHMMLKGYSEAVSAFQNACRCDPLNNELLNAYRNVLEGRIISVVD
ncbi:hsp70-Hsp90 organizing protein 2-like [Spinacia oleracea]|uniref:Hsp70-Hsp90 organizing protein 2-like n=1 Tax=Spinacia oleracea TaxID=3562 RepID=A0ABM3QN40_SPIOL|nr:hsp70-Hsp90 organizing protein 2-like [Spinacia oleracea]